MLPLPRGAVWQALFLLCAVLFINEVRSEGRVVCYYTNWSVYRPGTAKFNPQNINPYLCTHLVYAFGGFTKDNQMKPFDKYQDIEQGGYAKFTGLKTYNKQLKTMIAIGGWNEASSRFSPLVANPERRQQFIKNILKFLRQNHFDGIDLDWEYPAHRQGGKSRDRDNYAQFVQELRGEFEREAEKTGRPRLLLTMAVPAGIEYIDKGYDIPKLNKYLDWFNLLSYDFHSSHEPSANHHAPLYSLEEESEYNYDTELNIDYSVKYYLKAGADRDKLVLGIPTYGRSYTLINEDSNDIGAPSEGPGEQGDATREKGYLAYYEICQNLKEDPEWTVVQPNPNAMGPYAFKRNQWVGYDDEDIVRKKAHYVVEHGLGGIMFWAIDNDDFRGICTGKPYPLIEAAKEAMLDGLGLGINEVSKPSSPKKPLRSRSRENSDSSRNRISDVGEKRRPAGATRKQTTTEAPRTTTIKLTEAEGSSLYVGGRTTTPPPPTTPDPGTDFKCEEEGFFQHPRDCKKYYWCLDSGPSGLGIVAHQFTCPSGLYFNPAADSCDFARNVPCKTKKSTTAAPVTSTTTTPRPTTSSNRITAATSRNSYLRTTTRRTTTTSTTTEAPPEEEEVEYEDEEDVPSISKDRDPEEDPKVIQELIDLIRKLGGIEELEKHLLRKEDGSISLKEQNPSSSLSETKSSGIAKTLYEKVVSRPNTYNSFRNRLTSSSLYKKNAATETDRTNADSSKYAAAGEAEEDEVVGRSSSSGSSSYSKYSSVVRSNSRQTPQNEGLEKLPEFDAFIKEKKQYVTINRNRGPIKAQQDDDEEGTEEDDEDNAEILDEEIVNTSRKTVGGGSTQTYSTIRRNKTPTVTSIIEEDYKREEEDRKLRIEQENHEKKIYATLNRTRGRFPTIEPAPTAATNDDITTTNRYKYFERTRPTKPTTHVTDAEEQEANEDDDENEEEQENVMVQLTSQSDSATQKSQTTRLYASIGRKTTTTIAPTESTEIETPTNVATIITNPSDTTNSTEPTPEPISTSTATPTTTRTTATNKPELITTTSHPTTSTSTSTIISTKASTLNAVDSSSLYDSTTIVPAIILSNSDTTEDSGTIYTDKNSLLHETLPTLESGLDTSNQDLSENVEKTITTAKTTTKTLTTTGTTDTDGLAVDDKVTNLNKNLTKTQYKYIRTRKPSTTTIKTTKTTTNDNNESTTNTTKTTITSNNDSVENSLNLDNGKGSNSVNVKYSGGRRQQIKPTDSLYNIKSQIQTQQTPTTLPTTETSPTNEFLGTVSSPRPFGFPRRRLRPSTTTTTTTTETSNNNPSTGEQNTAVEDTSSFIKSTENTKKVSSQNVNAAEAHLLVENYSGVADENRNRGSTTGTHSQMHVTNLDNLVNGKVQVESILDKNHYLNNNKEVTRLFTWRDARRPTVRPLEQTELTITDETKGHVARGQLNRFNADSDNQNAILTTGTDGIADGFEKFSHTNLGNQNKIASGQSQTVQREKTFQDGSYSFGIGKRVDTKSTEDTRTEVDDGQYRDIYRGGFSGHTTFTTDDEITLNSQAESLISGHVKTVSTTLADDTKAGVNDGKYHTIYRGGNTGPTLSTTEHSNSQESSQINGGGKTVTTTSTEDTTAVVDDGKTQTTTTTYRTITRDGSAGSIQTSRYPATTLHSQDDSPLNGGVSTGTLTSTKYHTIHREGSSGGVPSVTTTSTEDTSTGFSDGKYHTITRGDIGGSTTSTTDQTTSLNIQNGSPINGAAKPLIEISTPDLTNDVDNDKTRTTTTTYKTITRGGSAGSIQTSTDPATTLHSQDNSHLNGGVSTDTLKSTKYHTIHREGSSGGVPSVITTLTEDTTTEFGDGKYHTITTGGIGGSTTSTTDQTTTYNSQDVSPINGAAKPLIEISTPDITNEVDGKYHSIHRVASSGGVPSVTTTSTEDITTEFGDGKYHTITRGGIAGSTTSTADHSTTFYSQDGSPINGAAKPLIEISNEVDDDKIRTTTTTYHTITRGGISDSTKSSTENAATLHSQDESNINLDNKSASTPSPEGLPKKYNDGKYRYISREDNAGLVTSTTDHAKTLHGHYITRPNGVASTEDNITGLDDGKYRHISRGGVSSSTQSTKDGITSTEDTGQYRYISRGGVSGSTQSTEGHETSLHSQIGSNINDDASKTVSTTSTEETKTSIDDGKTRSTTTKYHSITRNGSAGSSHINEGASTEQIMTEVDEGKYHSISRGSDTYQDGYQIDKPANSASKTSTEDTTTEMDDGKTRITTKYRTIAREGTTGSTTSTTDHPTSLHHQYGTRVSEGASTEHSTKEVGGGQYHSISEGGISDSTTSATDHVTSLHSHDGDAETVSTSSTDDTSTEVDEYRTITRNGSVEASHNNEGVSTEHSSTEVDGDKTRTSTKYHSITRSGSAGSSHVNGGAATEHSTTEVDDSKYHTISRGSATYQDGSQIDEPENSASTTSTEDNTTEIGDSKTRTTTKYHTITKEGTSGATTSTTDHTTRHHSKFGTHVNGGEAAESTTTKVNDGNSHSISREGISGSTKTTTDQENTLHSQVGSHINEGSRTISTTTTKDTTTKVDDGKTRTRTKYRTSTRNGTAGSSHINGGPSTENSSTEIDNGKYHHKYHTTDRHIQDESHINGGGKTVTTTKIDDGKTRTTTKYHTTTRNGSAGSSRINGDESTEHSTKEVGEDKNLNITRGSTTYHFKNIQDASQIDEGAKIITTTSTEGTSTEVDDGKARNATKYYIVSIDNGNADSTTTTTDHGTGLYGQRGTHVSGSAITEDTTTKDGDGKYHTISTSDIASSTTTTTDQAIKTASQDGSLSNGGVETVTTKTTKDTTIEVDDGKTRSTTKYHTVSSGGDAGSITNTQDHSENSSHIDGSSKATSTEDTKLQTDDGKIRIKTRKYHTFSKAGSAINLNDKKHDEPQIKEIRIVDMKAESLVKTGSVNLSSETHGEKKNVEESVGSNGIRSTTSVEIEDETTTAEIGDEDEILTIEGIAKNALSTDTVRKETTKLKNNKDYRKAYNRNSQSLATTAAPEITTTEGKTRNLLFRNRLRTTVEKTSTDEVENNASSESTETTLNGNKTRKTYLRTRPTTTTVAPWTIKETSIKSIDTVKVTNSTGELPRRRKVIYRGKYRPRNETETDQQETVEIKEHTSQTTLGRRRRPVDKTTITTQVATESHAETTKYPGPKSTKLDIIHSRVSGNVSGLNANKTESESTVATLSNNVTTESASTQEINTVESESGTQENETSKTEPKQGRYRLITKKRIISNKQTGTDGEAENATSSTTSGEQILTTGTSSGDNTSTKITTINRTRLFKTTGENVAQESLDTEHKENGKISVTTGTVSKSTASDFGRKRFGTSGSKNITTELNNETTAETVEAELDHTQSNLAEDLTTTTRKTSRKYYIKEGNTNSATRGQLSETSASSANRFRSRLHSNTGKASNEEELSAQTEAIASGDRTRSRTTSSRTFGTSGQTQKNIQRTRTKTIKKEDDNEYEYVYDVVTKNTPSTTRRPISSQRGAVKFQSNDLSSLLALDFATKPRKTDDGVTNITKTRRRLVKKPKTTTSTETETETEEIKEYEYETVPRSTISTTEVSKKAIYPTIRRQRPTRPAKIDTTETKTTIVATNSTSSPASKTVFTKRRYQFKRPTKHDVDTKSSDDISTETNVETIAKKPVTNRYQFRKPQSRKIEDHHNTTIPTTTVTTTEHLENELNTKGPIKIQTVTTTTTEKLAELPEVTTTFTTTTQPETLEETTLKAESTKEEGLENAGEISMETNEKTETHRTVTNEFQFKKPENHKYGNQKLTTVQLLKTVEPTNVHSTTTTTTTTTEKLAEQPEITTTSTTATQPGNLEETTLKAESTKQEALGSADEISTETNEKTEIRKTVTNQYQFKKPENHRYGNQKLTRVQLLKNVGPTNVQSITTTTTTNTENVEEQLNTVGPTKIHSKTTTTTTKMLDQPEVTITTIKEENLTKEDSGEANQSNKKASVTKEASSVTRVGKKRTYTPPLDPLHSKFFQGYKKIKQYSQNSENETVETTKPITSSSEDLSSNTTTTQTVVEELNKSGEAELSLPIYHRRKYYQYYKDSPITYVEQNSPATTTQTSSVDIKKQIKDVFNISEDHFVTPATTANLESKLVKEQAEEINKELGNFLLKTPRS